jgi:hypothetical protein
MVCAFTSNMHVMFALQTILIVTATRRNGQEWTNCKLHESCEPHGLTSGFVLCAVLLFVYFSFI